MALDIVDTAMGVMLISEKDIIALIYSLTSHCLVHPFLFDQILLESKESPLIAAVLSYLYQGVPIMRSKVFPAFWTLTILFNKLHDFDLLDLRSFCDTPNKLYLDFNALGMRLSPYELGIFDLHFVEPLDLLEENAQKFSTLSAAQDPRRPFVPVAIGAKELLFGWTEDGLIADGVESAGLADIRSIGYELEPANRAKNGGLLFHKHKKRIILYISVCGFKDETNINRSILHPRIGDFTLIPRSVTKWHAIVQFSYRHLISLLLFPQPHDFSLELLDYIELIHILITSQLLYLTLHGLVDNVVLVYLYAELFIHSRYFSILEANHLPQLQYFERAFYALSIIVLLDHFSQAELDGKQLSIVLLQFASQLLILVVQSGVYGLYGVYYHALHEFLVNSHQGTVGEEIVNYFCGFAQI